MGWKRGLVIFACWLLVAGGSLVAMRAFAQSDCEIELGEDDPRCDYDEGGSEEDGGGESNGGSSERGVLEMERDGRLNPVADEHYSVWCQEDTVVIWASQVDAAGPIDTFPIANLLGDVAPFTTPTGINVEKAEDGDTIVLTGSPGNNPGVGSKTFSLALCIERNGGEPEPEVTEQARVLPPQPEETEEPPTPQPPGLEPPTDPVSMWLAVLNFLCGVQPLAAMVLPVGFLLRRRRRQ